MNQIIIDYLSNGMALVPIPKGKKGPTLPDWNAPNMAITDIAKASTITGNVGLAHAYCIEPTAALDIDNYAEAKKILAGNGVDLDALYGAENAVRIESGRANRGKLLFKLPPNAEPIETYKYNDNNGNAIFELRCASRNKKTVQDVLPPSIHPDTGKPYTWGGNGHWSKLPIIPVELMFAWNNILLTKNYPSQNEVSLIGEVSQETITELKSALMHLSADNRELWVKMGLALKNVEDKGFSLWLEWSATSPKFNSKDATRVWESLTPTTIDYRSVFSEAQKHGWKTTIKVTNNHSALAIPNGFTAEDLSKKMFTPLAWVVQDILPEGCYILSARPKVGKSWLALQTCLGVAYGTSVLGKNVTNGKAIYLALEDNPRRLQDRLKQLRPQGYATPNLILHTNWLAFDNGGLESIEAIIQLHQPKILVIDTLAKVRPKMARNSSVYESDYNALAPLTVLANKYRCCILVVTHNRKGKSDTDALEQVSGSLGLTGAVDGALVIDGVRTDKNYKLSLIGRDIPNDDELAISRNSNGEWQILGQAKEVFISEERKAISELLKLHPKGLKPKEISELLGKKPTATRRLLTSMLADMQVCSTHGIYTHINHNGNSGNDSSDA
jgi:predicted ATP-dependent serine protease